MFWTHLINPRFSSGVVFLGEVPQVVVIVEVEVRHQLLVNHRLTHDDTICNACRLGTIKERPISIGRGGLITWEKRMPRTLLPSRSKGGDQHIIPIMLGTTSRIAPEMPDLAGKPTWTGGANKTSKSKLEALEAKKIPEFLMTHMEGKLSREVVHATGMHETQGVTDSLSAQHTLACDWTNAPIGQCGSHDASWLTGHLNGAQLEQKNLVFVHKASYMCLLSLQVTHCQPCAFYQRCQCSITDERSSVSGGDWTGNLSTIYLKKCFSERHKWTLMANVLLEPAAS